MKRILSLMVILSLAPLALWAEYGKSNVMHKEIHRPAQTAAPVPAAKPALTPAVKPTPVPAVKPAAVPTVKPGPAAAPANLAPEQPKRACPQNVYYPFTIHIISSQDLKAARKELERMQSSLGEVFITKTDLGPQGIWYRVDYGAFVAAKDAAAKMKELQGKGVIAEDAFMGGQVPYAIELATLDAQDQAGIARELSRYQKLGLTVYRIEEQGCLRLLTGAFAETRNAARVLTEIQRLGVNAKIAKR